jgi:hypothetical protein
MAPLCHLQLRAIIISLYLLLGNNNGNFDGVAIAGARVENRTQQIKRRKCSW